eukprot:525138_1
MDIPALSTKKRKFESTPPLVAKELASLFPPVKSLLKWQQQALNLESVIKSVVSVDNQYEPLSSLRHLTELVMEEMKMECTDNGLELNGAPAQKPSVVTNGVTNGSAKTSDNVEICRFNNLRCLAPRGRFCVQFFTSHMLLRPQSKLDKPDCPETVIPIKTISSLLDAPKVGDKDQFLFLHASEKYSHGKQKLDTVLILFKQDDEIEITLPAGYEHVAEKDMQGKTWTVLKRMFTSVLKTDCTVLSTDKAIFKSAKNEFAFKCYEKSINDGFMYPLKKGILFITKPVLFFPRNKIQMMQFGRHDVTGSRSVDLEIEMDNKVYSFGMIERAEQGPLTHYVKASNLAKYKAGADGSEGAEADAESSESESEVGDSDFDPEDAEEVDIGKFNENLDEEFDSELEQTTAMDEEQEESEDEESG